MTKFVFRADLRCRLSNGKTEVLRRHRVTVFATNAREARDLLAAEATDQVDAAGGELLESQLERLEVVRCELI